MASDQEWRTYIPSNSIKYLYFAFVFVMAKWHIYQKKDPRYCSLTHSKKAVGLSLPQADY